MHPILRYLESALFSRQPSTAQRLALAVVRGLRPGVLETRETVRRHMMEHVRVSVRAYGDDDPDLYRRLRMGDTWLKNGLIDALGRAGYVVTDFDPDVVIHLFGEPIDLPPRAVKVLWVHSHPERLASPLLERYDHVFCASERLAARLSDRGIRATNLSLATALRPMRVDPRYEVVFVGNARPEGTRPILEALGSGFDLRVWGGGYRALPESVWMGPYAPYPDLSQIYGASVISLNDHLPSMAEAGIVTPRVFDILASGGFCISDANVGLRDVFGEAVPQYRTPAELRSLVRHFLDHPEERDALMAEGRRIALGSVWSDRVAMLMSSVRVAAPWHSRSDLIPRP